MARLTFIHTLIKTVRDALLCVVLLSVIVFGATFLQRFDEAANKLPDYCYANDARASAPECKRD